MRYFQGLLILFLLFCSSPSPAQNENNMTAPQYRVLARQAFTDWPVEGFDFMYFRALYSQMPHYDPLGMEAKERLLEYAYTAQQETDKKKQEKALAAYDALIAGHLAHIDVVTQALALSRDDKNFGDPAFFEWVRAGLVQSVIDSGDGTSLTQAYDVITPSEEIALLKALNVQVLKTDMRQSEDVYYNMHEVRDAEHEGTYTIFVDLSPPMDWLAEQRLLEKRNIAIPKQ